jgi:hypothetical protein
MGLVDWAQLYSRFSVISQTPTTKLPHVGIWGSLVVESSKNGQFFSWNYLVGLFGGINRVLPPARGRPNPRAAPRHRQRPPRASPRSSIRRPLRVFKTGKQKEISGFGTTGSHHCL